jgi:hypothetical protein
MGAAQQVKPKVSSRSFGRHQPSDGQIDRLPRTEFRRQRRAPAAGAACGLWHWFQSRRIGRSALLDRVLKVEAGDEFMAVRLRQHGKAIACVEKEAFLTKCRQRKGLGFSYHLVARESFGELRMMGLCDAKRCRVARSALAHAQLGALCLRADARRLPGTPVARRRVETSATARNRGAAAAPRVVGRSAGPECCRLNRSCRNGCVGTGCGGHGFGATFFSETHAAKAKPSIAVALFMSLIPPAFMTARPRRVTRQGIKFRLMLRSLQLVTAGELRAHRV